MSLPSGIVLKRKNEKLVHAPYFCLLGVLFFFLSYLVIWPMIWHLAILPYAQPNKHQLRIESYFQNRVVNSSLYLDNPDSTLTAYAVWQVPEKGLYHFKLSCDDNGEVIIDNHLIITLRGISPNNIGEAKKWLTPGPHFLEMRLNNIYEKGWLKIEVAGPGQVHYRPLSLDELSYPELGNIETLLDVVFWGKAFCLFGFLGLGLLSVMFYFRQWTNRLRSKQEAAETRGPAKPIPSYFLLWAGFFLLFFHFAIWPLIWHWVILPHAIPGNHQLRVESNSPYRIDNALLFLDKPDSSLSAYAVWQIPRGGLYRLKLSCVGNGKVLIDSRPVITMKGLPAFNVWEAKTWLAPGPHFLELRLSNNLRMGWLRMDVAGPGQANYSPLSSNELSFLPLGNVETWVGIVFWGEYLCFLGFLGLFLLWFGLFYFRRWAGKIFPNRRWENFFLILTMFALTLSIIFYTKHPLPPIYGDGIGYYSYLPSYLIYHDPTMESIFQPLGGYDYHCGGVFVRYPTTGRYLVKYPVGTAVLMLPFFLLGHLVAPLLGSTPDGFSLVYQFTIVLATVFYMLVGLVLLFKILIEYFSPKVVMATILSLFLGTNFLALATTAVSLSHIYSFFLICLLLYLVPRWYADPSLSNTLFLGALAGMIVLVRNPNALFLLFLPLYGILNRDTLRERIHFLWQEKNKVFFLLALAILVFSPQALILWITTNQLLFNSYTFDVGFYFFSPQIFNVLFSPYHGLFIWSPILIFSVLGLWRMEGPLKLYRLPIIVCLLLHLYLVSSWSNWWYGWSFGHRAFVDAFGLFALPLAAFFGSLRRKIVKRGVIIINTLFIAITLYSYIQFFQGVLPGEMSLPMTWQQYKTFLIKTDGMVELWQWLKNPTVNNYRLSR